MSLENYTGKIADLVITNPTPTDPKSQGDDHLRGIKKTIVDDAVRVSGSPLQQLGASATASENHHWDGSVPNQLSLKRGTPDAPGAELINVLNGVLSFPNQGQSLTDNGYVKLPGGLIVQWGSATADVGADKTVSFPAQFSSGYLAISLCPTNGSGSGAYMATVGSGSSTSFNFSVWSGGASPIRTNQAVFWIAIGH